MVDEVEFEIMDADESKVEEYMNTLSLLKRDKEEVSNVILGYMLDCQMKDNEIEVLNRKITAFEEMLGIAWDAITEAGYEGYSNKLKEFIENNYD